MTKLIFKLFIVFCVFTLPLESKNFNNILINGNDRISDDTIKVFSEIPKDKSLNETSLNLILKNLFNTGFFKDVSVIIKNNDLIINVEENPIIQSVLIEGVKTERIRKSINDILTLRDRSSFNIVFAKNDEIAILSTLKDMGYFFATLESSIIEIGDNKVNLIYNIDIGKKARISKISFVGDKKFKDNKLRGVIVSEEYKFWKIVSGKKFLNENLINFDKKLLENFYKNNGFFNVIIQPSFASYLGDNNFDVIYNISSGKKYFFNKLTLNLPVDYNVENFDKLNLLFEDLRGKKYSLNSINLMLDEIDNIVLNKQYEFLNATVSEKIDDNLINLTFNIEESEKFYVETINILGNNITHEEVIRNTLLVDEGDPFNELLHNKSINEIKALSYFSKVESEIKNGTSKGKKIINIKVNEKPTGEIMAGAGIGTNGGSVAFGITENNFLGRGIKFGTDLSISDEAVRGIISLDNPNYKGLNRSLGVTLESTVTDRLSNYGYKSIKTGTSFSTGFEYYDDMYLRTGLSTYVEKLETDSTASENLKRQKGSYFDTYVNYTLDYDKRNQRYQTTDGFRSRFSQNIPLASQSYSLTNTYDYKNYNQWLDENIATFGFFVSSSNSLSGKDIKLSERLFLPSNKLRGFEVGKLGPKDGADYIGGNYAASINFSTTLPQIMPNTQNTDFSLFLDAANIWGIDYDSDNGTAFDNSQIRSSIGIAVDFFTPIGPLNFSLTEVLMKHDSDKTETFKFNLGTTF